MADIGLRSLEREVAANGSPEAQLRLLRAKERVDGFNAESVKISGDVIEATGDNYEVSAGLVCVTFDDGTEYVLALDAETAGQAARERWAEMAENDPSEFRAMVGDDCLVNWALGQYAGPGTTQVKSLEEWLDLHLDIPEEEFAGYDGLEVDVDRIGSELAEEIGFIPTVAYRTN